MSTNKYTVASGQAFARWSRSGFRNSLTSVAVVAALLAGGTIGVASAVVATTTPASATSASTSAILPGFDSTVYGGNDDGSYPCTGENAAVPQDCSPTPVTLPFPIDFYGNAYNQIHQ